MRFILGFLTSLITVGAAYAGDGPYVAAGMELGRYTVEDPAETYSDVALNLRLGYDFSKYLGVEAEGVFHIGGAATSDETIGSERYEQSGDVTGRLGGFVRGRIPLSEKIDVFARIGAGGRRMTDKSRTTGEVNGVPFDERTSFSEVSLFTSLGAGVEFEVSTSGRDLIRGDYTFFRTFIGYWVDDSAASIAYVRRF